MASKSIVYDEYYEGLPIMTNIAKGHGCDPDILRIIKEQFDYAEVTKRKIFVIRYDIRFPLDGQYDHSNWLISSFQADLMKALKREKEGCEPQYVVVREQSREKHHHYHGLLLLDGNKVQNIHGVLNRAEEIWDRKVGATMMDKQNGGLIERCTSDRDGNYVGNGVMLRHDDPDREVKLHACFKRASYLAKVNQKGYAPSGCREVFASRIPDPYKPPK